MPALSQNNLQTNMEEKNADFEQEGQSLDAFMDGEQENETSEESQTETNETEASQSEEGANTPQEDKPQPFHEHPRWKQREEEMKTLREENEGFKQSLKDVQAVQQSNQVTTLPQWWTKLYGNDSVSQEAYGEYSGHEKEQRNQIREEVRQEQQEFTQKQQDEQSKWDTWVQGEVTALQSEGNTFDKNELMKVAMDIRPTDEQGNISLRKSLDILNLKKSGNDKSKQERKRIAASTGQSIGGDAKDVTPSNVSLRNRSMTSLAQDY